VLIEEKRKKKEKEENKEGLRIFSALL